MSLADEWDSLPAAAPAARASLADEWDAIKPDANAGAAKPAVAKTMPGNSAADDVVLNQLTSLGKSIIGGWRGLAALATGAGLKEAADQVENPQLAGGQRAATYEPAPGTPGAKAVEAVASPVNPMNWPGLIAHKAGDVTMEATNSPVAATAVETGLNAIPLVLGKKSAARAEPKLVGSSSIADAKPATTPIAEIAQGENLEVPTILRRGGKVAVETPGRAPLSLVPKEGEAPAPSATETPKRTLSLVQNEPTPGRTESAKFSTPPEAAAAESEANAPKFSESAPPAPVGETLPAEEQSRRAAVLQRVGLDQTRASAVTGDAKAAATDFQTSKLDNAAGNYMRTVLDNERGALTGHAEQIVRDTGGTLGTDAQTLEARGHAILSPLESFRQWFTDQTNGLYAQARERAAGQPLALGRFQDVLGTDSKFANTDTIELRKGIQARMKELGMLDKDGNAMPATVEQAENLRQYINEEWSPKSNGRIRELKNALDEDVTSAAGDDIFKQARALHAMKQSIFADPKGLSSILDSEGINRKVPIEKIPDAIAALPNAQFAHIVETLKHVPAELQPQAQAALAEIKAQFANRMRDAGASRVGQWGARDVTAYLNKNAAKMTQVFSPEEMARVQDLNDAGHILAQDRSYPGAAVQTHNLVQRGVLTALPKAGAAVGGVLGAVIGAPGTGALMGDAVGAAAANRFGESAALKATQKRVVKLGDFPK